MKNIHVLPTDKPSRIYLIKSNNKLGITSNNPEFTENFGSGTQNQHIYITSDEEIKDIRPHGGKWQLEKGEILNKVIMTTDQDLIKNGVQAIDDEFLEWFVKNPSCEEVETVFNNRGISGAEKILKSFGEYEIIIPKVEPKQETLGLKVSEETVYYQVLIVNNKGEKLAFKQNNKWTINASTEEILDQIFKTI